VIRLSYHKKMNLQATLHLYQSKTDIFSDAAACMEAEKTLASEAVPELFNKFFSFRSCLVVVNFRVF
jgi:hypothetical protein